MTDRYIFIINNNSTPQIGSYIKILRPRILSTNKSQGLMASPELFQRASQNSPTLNVIGALHPCSDSTPRPVAKHPYCHRDLLYQMQAPSVASRRAHSLTTYKHMPRCRASAGVMCGLHALLGSQQHYTVSSQSVRQPVSQSASDSVSRSVHQRRSRRASVRSARYVATCMTAR